MCHPQQPVGIVADCLCDLQIVLFDVFRNGGLARKNPQVVQALSGYQRIGVVSVNRNDIISGVKRAKEGYFQARDAVTPDELGFADGLLPVNYLHPFREGNGRTQREFLRLLALEKGLTLNLNPPDNKSVYEKVYERNY